MLWQVMKYIEYQIIDIFQRNQLSENQNEMSHRKIKL